jgi:cell division protein FtsW (lipid II flippase)
VNYRDAALVTGMVFGITAVIMGITALFLILAGPLLGTVLLFALLGIGMFFLMARSL